MIDHELVRRLRLSVAERLERPAASRPDRRHRPDDLGGRAGVRPFADRAGPRGPRRAARSTRGARPPRRRRRRPSSPQRIHAALFGVGRLQPLLDDPDVENIDINGCDDVFVGYADGARGAAPAGRRERRGARRARPGPGRLLGLDPSRPFDTANPQLDLRLPDGSRLSAVMGVCSRPSVSIRRSRLRRVFLDDLVADAAR